MHFFSSTALKIHFLFVWRWKGIVFYWGLHSFKYWFRTWLVVRCWVFVKILNILKRKCRLVISQNVLLFVATLNLLPRFCILIVLDVFEFHRLVVSKIVRFHYRSSVFAFWKFFYLIRLVITLLLTTFFLFIEIEAHWLFRVFNLLAFILTLISIVVT